VPGRYHGVPKAHKATQLLRGAPGDGGAANPSPETGDCARQTSDSDGDDRSVLLCISGKSPGAASECCRAESSDHGCPLS